MSPEQIEYLQAHYNVDRPPKELAQELGVKPHTLRNRIYKLRQKGYQFTGNHYEVGTTTKHKSGKVMTKTETGWKYEYHYGRKTKPL